MLKQAVVFCVIFVLAHSARIRNVRRGGSTLDYFSEFQQTSTTQKPAALNYEEILQDPNFLAYLESIKNKNQATTTTTTTTLRPPPVTFPPHKHNPFLDQEDFFENFDQRYQQQQQQKHDKVDYSSNPFFNTHQNKNTFIQIPHNNNNNLKSNAIQSRTSLTETQPADPFAIIPTEATPKTPKIQVPLAKFTGTVQQASKTDELTKKLEEEIFKKQAQSAKYEFASAYDDSINQNQHQREEVRDGLSVRGKYSYSDGFFKRTVEYEADDKGYRVVGEQVEEIGQGPQVNPDGRARVATYVAGNAVKYEITEDDVQKKKKTAELKQDEFLS